MRDIGVSITGKNVLIVGYGMIGETTARALNAANLSVSVYDIRDHRNLTGFMAGFRVHKKAELLRMADIVVCVTGWSSTKNTKPALSLDEILEQVKHNSILVSAGSQDNEFNVAGLKELAVSIKQLSDYVTQYDLPNTKTVYVIKDGTAVNFLLPSMPVQILDLVFAEIVLSTIMLVKNNCDIPIGCVNVTEEKNWNAISKDWLRFSNY